MVTISLRAVALISVLVAMQPQDLRLSDLIPLEKWEKIGISKLTDSERVLLQDEIVAFLQGYINSFTDGVAIIAPSVSTSMKASEIRAQLRKKEVPLRFAETILVVVRSSLLYPLEHSYDCVVGLREDAENQLNISGPNFHVYLYSMDDNLAVTEISHRFFEAE